MIKLEINIKLSVKASTLFVVAQLMTYTDSMGDSAILLSAALEPYLLSLHSVI